MRYVAIEASDIGINKIVNQDSLLIRHTTHGKDEILMAIICDGIGGLSDGEVASATVVNRFDEWFSKSLPHELHDVDMDVIGEKWSLLLKTLNIEIQESGLAHGKRMGTTFTGVIFVNGQFVLVHIGDTRFYHIGNSLKQISKDHTFVAREVENGRLTPHEAKNDRRKNMLLQCVGASRMISPQIVHGSVEPGTYLLCSDGFRHKLSEDEIYDAFNPKELSSKQKMHDVLKALIELNKQRNEKDDISAILIKADPNIETKRTYIANVLRKFSSDKI